MPCPACGGDLAPATGALLEIAELVRVNPEEECWNCHQYSRGDLNGDTCNEVDPVATLPQGDRGKSRDIVADKVGMSGRTFDKARTIWDKAKEGDEQAGKLIKEIDTGKKAVHTAFKEIKKDQDLEERQLPDMDLNAEAYHQ